MNGGINMRKQNKLSLLVVLLIGMLILGANSGGAFDLTDYGFKPVGSYDFEGETVTIISWTSERMSNYFSDYLPVEGRVEEAEKLFNCKIEWMQTRDIPEVNFNRLLAGESVNDLWHVQNKIGYWELVAADALYPISEILGDEYYDMLPPSFIAVEEAFKFKDQYWGIGPVEWRPIYGYQNDMMLVVYNKTLFDREGLDDLYELYQAGEWTWDKATEIAMKVTTDTDGDGEIDQWGIVDVRPWDLAVANGTSMTKVDENGQIVFNGDDPAYIEALEQYYRWWTELAVQMPTYNSTNLRDTFINGNAAMYFGQAAFGLGTIMDNMEDEWGLVPFPKGPSTDQHHWTVQALNTTVIPINAKDPEALAALRTFLWREDDVDVNDFLAAHVNSQESADVLLTANKEWEGQASRLFETFLGDFTTYTRDVASGTRGATAAMAEIKPIIQANLDDLFNQ